MLKVCAFVQADGLSLTPPMSWSKQFRTLAGLDDKAKKQAK
jgi:hypothetical protein